MKDLTTKEGREREIEAIGASFLEHLRRIKMPISDDAICIVNAGMIELAVIGGLSVSSSSNIKIYAAADELILPPEVSQILSNTTVMVLFRRTTKGRIGALSTPP